MYGSEDGHTMIGLPLRNLFERFFPNRFAQVSVPQRKQI